MFIINTSLLVPDAWKNEKDGDSGYPYVAKFRHGEKKLSYLAATHENSVNSKTFQLIAKEFNRSKPKVVIIEGLVRFSDQAEWHLGVWRGVSQTKPRAVSEHGEGVTGRLRSVKS